MKILAIETSCDESAIALLEAKKKKGGAVFSILGEAMFSQVKLHEKYGGVFPTLAKREHSKNLVPLLGKVLHDANIRMCTNDTNKKILKKKTCPPKFSAENFGRVKKILERELELFARMVPFLKKYAPPKIDQIAVTVGPGLEPALWVGINFAKALSLAWSASRRIPVIPVNHMEGHLLVALLQAHDTNIRMCTNDTNKRKRTINYRLSTINFPLLALLISGGHTELVLAKKIGSYKILGETRDDAVGEAFDKVARMLGLPYPGGPYISALAEISRNNAERTQKNADKIKLPRPMLHSNNLDFSFAGLKTAVLYLLKKLPAPQLGRLTSKLGGSRLDNKLKMAIAREFEDAATEVLVAKTRRAILNTNPKILIIGGGVSANTHIRREFEKMVKKEFPKVKLLIPEQKLTTDNAVMIGLAAFFKNSKKTRRGSTIRADGNLRLRLNDVVSPPLN